MFVFSSEKNSQIVLLTLNFIIQSLKHRNNPTLFENDRIRYCKSILKGSLKSCKIKWFQKYVFSAHVCYCVFRINPKYGNCTCKIFVFLSICNSWITFMNTKKLRIMIQSSHQNSKMFWHFHKIIFSQENENKI